MILKISEKINSRVFEIYKRIERTQKLKCQLWVYPIVSLCGPI